MRKYLLAFLLFTLLSANVFADLEITVDTQSDWGDITAIEIETLCQNIVSHFQDTLRDAHKIRDTSINVYYAEDGPFIQYAPPNKHNIAISALGVYLNQFTYQFSHELCHVLHNHEETMVDNPNLWFQESICMMASIWALKEMYRTWETNAPYKQWAFYRNFLLSYANNAMKRQGVQYAGTSAQWLTQWENFLRSDYKNSFTHHLRVSQLSYSFLPIFEEHPEAWNAVRQMPSSKGKIKEYMRAWYDGVDAEDKGFVQAIAEEMGINVLSDAPNADAPDMNSDFVSLSFTHRSANALTPTNDRDEWSGWTKEIWEKTPDFTITPRPKGYLDFAESDIWSHWMYAHAPSVVGYDISGATYTSFGAYFGLPNPGCHAGASMEFLAYADGRKIYSSELYYEDYGVYISFDIPSGSKSLKIKIGFLESDQCDHYVLGEPKLFTPIESKETDTDAADTTIIDADVNNDGSVDLSDVLIVRRGMTKKSTYDTDVNNDGTTNILDLLIVKAKAVEAIITASPQKRKANITTWGALKVR